jgi:diguanylate cyclase (GGDEF)-like protein
MGLTIQNSLQYKPESSATTDPLTGLPNARSLYVHLENEIARCQRESLPVALFLFRLDGIPQIDDRFGLLKGKKTLQIFASALKDSCRQSDYAARLAGHEFAVIAPAYRDNATPEMILRLEALASAAGKSACGDEALLSVKVRQASYPIDGNSAEQLLAEADRGLSGTKMPSISASSGRSAAAGA